MTTGRYIIIRLLPLSKISESATDAIHLGEKVKKACPLCKWKVCQGVSQLHDVADDDDVDEVVPEEETVSSSDDVRERCLDVDAECSYDVEIDADVDEPIAFLAADVDRSCSSGVQSTQPADSSQV